MKYRKYNIEVDLWIELGDRAYFVSDTDEIISQESKENIANNIIWLNSVEKCTFSYIKTFKNIPCIGFRCDVDPFPECVIRSVDFDNERIRIEYEAIGNKDKTAIR